MKKSLGIMVTIMVVAIISGLFITAKLSNAVEIGQNSRFIAYDNGTVLDTKTNLMWATKDNGSNIDWSDAKSYCENYKGGGYADWRMPTKDELKSLYDNAIFGNSGYHLTKLINLSESFIWTSDMRNASTVVFSFSKGLSYEEKSSNSRRNRALSVRSSGHEKEVSTAAETGASAGAGTGTKQWWEKAYAPKAEPPAAPAEAIAPVVEAPAAAAEAIAPKAEVPVATMAVAAPPAEEPAAPKEPSTDKTQWWQKKYVPKAEPQTAPAEVAAPAVEAPAAAAVVVAPQVEQPAAPVETAATPTAAVPAAPKAEKPVAKKVSMPLNIKFGTAKADISKNYDKDIKKVADLLKANPEATAVIEGHTDNVDIHNEPERNMRLSQARADSVRQYLIDNFGIDASRVTAIGYGPNKPIASNDTEEGKKKNRRVEAVIEMMKAK